MLESIKIWNEPNNASHWNLDLDEGWVRFCELLTSGVEGVRISSDLPVVLGGMSPIDPRFLRVLESRGALDGVDVIGVHGFPFDWNLWPMEEWPSKIEAIRQEFGRPVWVTETGASSFASEEKAAWGVRRLSRILAGEEVYWYTLLDLVPDAEATTRHKQAEGSGYFRHFHFGLLRHDGTPKAALREFNPELGICQWFQYEDERSLELAVRWLERLGVKRIRTGLSWSESLMEGGWEWLDTIMSALEPFEVCATVCFTPESLGLEPHHSSPPRDPRLFGEFAAEVTRRYAPSGVVPAAM
jgi:beta-xylosidase